MRVRSIAAVWLTLLMLSLCLAGVWAQDNDFAVDNRPAEGGGWLKTALAVVGVVLFLLLLIWNPGFALWLLFSIISGGRGGGYSGGGGGFRGFGGGRSGGGGASGSW